MPARSLIPGLDPQATTRGSGSASYCGPELLRPRSALARTVALALTILVAPLALSAADAVVWEAINFPTSGSVSSAVVGTVRIRNSGTTTWGPGYYLDIWDAAHVGRADTEPLGATVAPGEAVTVQMSIVLPSLSGTYGYNFTLYQSPGVGIIGPPQPRTFVANPNGGSVQLSTYAFVSADRPVISTDTVQLLPVPPAGRYKLRAKFPIVGVGTGFHATQEWENNGRPLQSLPPPGDYYPLALYWLKYDATGSTLLEIGSDQPLRHALIKDRQVALTSYYFNQATRPTISTNFPIPDNYRLAARVLYQPPYTLDTAIRHYNDQLSLDALPPPGTYTVQLFWQKFSLDPAQPYTVVETGAIRNETLTVVGGPIQLFAGGGYINSFLSTDEDGNIQTDYSRDFYDFQVPAAGTLRAWSSNPNGVSLFGYLSGGIYAAGQGIPSDFEISNVHVGAGTYSLEVDGMNGETDYQVFVEFVPDVPPPEIISPATATATVGAPFTYT
ncbi:MAG: Ig-like domain from next to, partial [Verrucomicrobiota bacterium]